MRLVVEAIKFNHNATSATGDALNIRVDNDTFVTVPEWRRGVTQIAADSPAAYAIQEIGTNTITVKVRFRVVGRLPVVGPFRLPATVEIRALAARRFPLPWPWPWPPHPPLSHPVPLGHVAARAVRFDASGDTGFVTMKCTAGPGTTVRATDIRWTWQYRVKGLVDWTSFDETRHRIYTILELPKAPWQQAPHTAANTQLPWTAVLDHACAWARGAASRDAAAGLLTDHIYGLGPGVVTYDCPGGGASHYSAAVFDCTSFLDLLDGGIGNGQYVNCSDCATFLSAFANILGCDLCQSRMGYDFPLNPILAIGSSVWQTACGWGGFWYHEVAWKGACGLTDPVFDACLAVNGGPVPTGPPYVVLLPKNMPFNQYRAKLVPAAGTGNCNPQPSTCTRRMIV